MIDRLNSSNFIMFCMKSYEGPNCLDVDSFQKDLKRIKYIKRLLNRYHNTGKIKDRLLLNHIIILNNSFGPEATAKILFFKIEKKLWPALKIFLIFLSLMPDIITNIGKEDILSSNVGLDPNIISILRKI